MKLSVMGWLFNIYGKSHFIAEVRGLSFLNNMISCVSCLNFKREAGEKFAVSDNKIKSKKYEVTFINYIFKKKHWQIAVV